MKKMHLKKITVGVAFVGTTLLSLSVGAWTKDEWDKTIAMVGSHISTNGFVSFVEGVDANCIYQNLYFDISTQIGKSMQNTLLAAKVTGKKVRVGYTPPAAIGTCMLEMAVLQ